MLEVFSGWAHRRLYGHDGYLCARAAWRGGAFWGAWRVVFNLVMLWREREHCEACLFRWLIGDD